MERQTLVEIAVSAGSVGLMIGAMMFVGSTYSENGELTTEGGQVLVGVIVLFVLLMFGVGYGLAKADFESDAEQVESDNANGA
jgi:hypothetical protein